MKDFLTRTCFAIVLGHPVAPLVGAALLATLAPQAAGEHGGEH